MGISQNHASKGQVQELKAWQDVVGIFKDLQITQGNVIVGITVHKRVTFAKEHAEKIIQALQKTPKGTKIALLRTDDPEKPVVLRTFKATTSANTHGSA